MLAVVHIPQPGFTIVPQVEAEPTHSLRWIYFRDGRENGELIYCTNANFTCEISIERIRKISGRLTMLFGTRCQQWCYSLESHRETVRRSDKQKFDTAMKIRFGRYMAAVDHLKETLKSSIFYDVELAAAMENLNQQHEAEIIKLKKRYNQT